MTRTSGKNIEMDSPVSRQDEQNSTEINPKRRASLFGLFFSRQKSSKCQLPKDKAASVIDSNQFSFNDIPGSSNQEYTSRFVSEEPTTFQDGASESDEKDTGCLGCSNCEESNRQRLTDEQSANPVDSANNYLAALQDLMEQEETVTATPCENIKKAKQTCKTEQSVRASVNTINDEYGIFSMSDDIQNARGFNCVATENNTEKIVSDTSEGLNKPLPKLHSGESSTRINEGKSKDYQCSQQQKSDVKYFQNSMTSSANDLNTLGPQEKRSTMTVDSSGVEYKSSGKNFQDCGAEIIRNSNVRKRAMSEASIFKPLLSTTKRLAGLLPNLSQKDSKPAEELYPVDIDDVAVDFDLNSGRVKLSLDSTSGKSCDNKLDSVVEEGDDHLHNVTREEARHLSQSSESVNEACVVPTKGEYHIENMNTTELAEPESDGIISPCLSRTGLTSKLGKNMDKPKPKDNLPSPSKTRSRSGSLPVLFAQQKESYVFHVDHQFTGLKKLGTIDEMDSDTDKSERVRKRSVFSGPGKLSGPESQNKVKNKARWSRTSIQENKVFTISIFSKGQFSVKVYKMPFLYLIIATRNKDFLSVSILVTPPFVIRTHFSGV